MKKLYNLVFVLLIFAFNANAQNLSPKSNKDKGFLGIGLFNKKNDQKTTTAKEFGIYGLDVSFADESSTETVLYDDTSLETEGEYFFENRYIQELTSDVPLARNWGGEYIVLRSNDILPYLWIEELVNNDEGGRIIENVNILDLNKEVELNFFRSHSTESGWTRELTKTPLTKSMLAVEEYFMFQVDSLEFTGSKKRITGMEAFKYVGTVSQNSNGEVFTGEVSIWFPEWETFLPGVDMLKKSDSNEVHQAIADHLFIWPLEMHIKWESGEETHLNTAIKEIHPLVINTDRLANVFFYENFIPLDIETN
ncbi:MAG: hypothetical protein KTR13_00310 [Saprospiraceae bacterium]|nr:hypothetical protein [Saprospiraceae bacterium]